MDKTLLNVLEFLKEGHNPIPEHLWRDIENVVQKIYIPIIKVGSERPCEVSDFEKYLPDLERRLKNILIVLTEIERKFGVDEKILSKQRAVSILLLCGEHACQDKWTTNNTIQLCEDLLQIVYRFWHCSSLSELLNGAKYEALFTPALLALRPKLLKNTWKTFPAAVSCYRWLLFNVKSPHLGQHLASVVPTALIILDDFVPENKVLGIRCLQHITDNVTRAELGWHGHGEVIYKSLEPLIYERDASIIEPLISCLIVVLDKVDGGYIKEQTNYEWNRYDEVLDRLLQKMELEDRLALRLAYVKSLPSLVETASLRMCRWSNRFLRICARYLEVAGFSEHGEAPHVLEAVRAFVIHCWPLVPHHAPAMLHMLLRLLYDMTEVENTSVCHLIEECLTLVVKIAPSECQIVCKDITTHTRFNALFAAVVDRVFPSVQIT